MISLTRRSSILLLSGVVFSLVGPLTFWLTSSRPEADAKVLIGTSPQASSNQSSVFQDPRDLQERFSRGERLLIPADNGSAKLAGIEFFRTNQFLQAQQSFQTALRNQRNDPEALIYLNNTLAELKGNPLQVAVSVPIGGNLNIAREILRGVAQAQADFNRNGGIGGRLLQVKIADDENAPEIAKKIATALTQDSNIIAIIGHNASEASLIAAPIYEQAGLVMISPTSTANGLSGIGTHIFRTTPSTRVTADALARYVVNVAQRRRIAICSASKDKASKSFKEDFAWSYAQYGGTMLNVGCDLSAADFNPALIPAQMTSSGADGLLLAPSLYTISQAVEIAQHNRGRLMLFGNQTMYGIETLQRGQANVNGMVLAVPWYPRALPGNSFLAESKKLWGAAVNWRTAMAFDATQAVLVGLRQGQSREKLFQALSNSEFAFNGATGRIQFLPSGDRSLQGTLVQVRPGNAAGVGYDFQYLATGAAAEPNPTSP
jgi:branched-chain amino acid transport system substrate-binding protein